MAERRASSLLTDLYQLTMLSAYYELGMEQQAVFEFYVRRLPDTRNFLIAAGLEQVLDYLQTLHFTDAELSWLAQSGQGFKPAFIDRLAKLRFTGDVYAMSEGTAFFAEEPILRVVAPLPEAQLIESRVINLLHLQVAIASKAARCRIAAGTKRLVDFGMRRAHGAEAALLGARASFIGGFDATACVAAAREFGIPMSGTMAHSFIEAHDQETDAFLNFAACRPQLLTLLIDTYDTNRAARSVTRLANQLADREAPVIAVRIDSGDLAEQALHVRGILDADGGEQIEIFASGNVDEHLILACNQRGAPIDGFGIGTKLSASTDAPVLDCVYKLHEYAGKPRRKSSPSKGTWPGRRQVHRTYDEQGYIALDLISAADEIVQGRALLQPVMSNGHRTWCPSLAEIRKHCRDQVATLPAALRSLDHGPRSPVKISTQLRSLAAQIEQSHNLPRVTP